MPHTKRRKSSRSTEVVRYWKSILIHLTFTKRMHEVAQEATISYQVTKKTPQKTALS